ncbi:MAG: histidine phosphatase family protein [Anaerolineae bacterium]
MAEVHRGQLVLISTHGRVMKCLTAAALDKQDTAIPYPKNCGVVIFRYSEGQPLQFIEVRD